MLPERLIPSVHLSSVVQYLGLVLSCRSYLLPLFYRCQTSGLCLPKVACLVTFPSELFFYIFLLDLSLLLCHNISKICLRNILKGFLKIKTNLNCFKNLTGKNFWTPLHFAYLQTFSTLPQEQKQTFNTSHLLCKVLQDYGFHYYIFLPVSSPIGIHFKLWLAIYKCTFVCVLISICIYNENLIVIILCLCLIKCQH